MSRIDKSARDRFDETKARVRHAIETAAGEAARIVQDEVVARVPVKTGKAKAWLSSAAAIAPLRAGNAWRFGLITPELRKNAHYLIFVEYGTKGYMRGQMRSYTTRGGQVRTRKAKRAVPARPARPFFRPGLDAARARVKAHIVQAAKDALRD